MEYECRITRSCIYWDPEKRENLDFKIVADSRLEARTILRQRAFKIDISSGSKLVQDIMIKGYMGSGSPWTPGADVMENNERDRLEDLDRAIEKRQEIKGRVAYATGHPLLDKIPILRKSEGPCPKMACLDCHNYDSDSSLGYTCLIKGTSREDPTIKAPCCYFIAKGQTRLGLGRLLSYG